MYEILPLATGIMFALGLTWWGPMERRSRVFASLLFALVVGFIAASVSGELAKSWAFILVDAAATLVAIVVATSVLERVGWIPDRR
jgi:hypothetical protein